MIARKTPRAALAGLPVATALAVLLAGCQPEEQAQKPVVRPVRTVMIEAPRQRTSLSFTGRIEAKDEVALSFRIGGRLAERAVGVGAQVREGEAIARLEPQNELNALRSARAALASAEGVSIQAANRLDRQRRLLERGVTTRAYFEDAEQADKAARSSVEAARAQLRNAEDLVGFTELDADAPGIVTAIGAEPGEVVAAGQMIVVLARRDGRDAVFDVPAALLRSIPYEARVSVSLPDAPAITAAGRIREIAPQADPVTRTFQVRAGLSDPPAAFRLGASVVATLSADVAPTYEVPSSALTGLNDAAAVWIVDPKSLTVARRKVEVAQAGPAFAAIAAGLSQGDIVVTAGAASLKDGQAVRLLGTEL
jgi:RND family efflux transporter MFP subunit